MSEKVQVLDELKDNYPLPRELIAEYGEKGHVIIRGLASRQLIDYYRPLIVRDVIRLNEETRPLAERDTYGKAFLQIQNLWESSEAVRQGNRLRI